MTGRVAGKTPSLAACGLTVEESRIIVRKIRPIFAKHVAQYDTGKYWPDVYDRVLAAFRDPDLPSAQSLDEALRWKYGHLGKPRIPEAHRRLIAQIQRTWPRRAPELSRSPEAAFELLNATFGGAKRFVTMGFLLHLLFPARTPIIDQHNFRAVNALVRSVRPTWQGRATPSRYADIELVRDVIDAIVAAWSVEHPASTPSVRELDEFLMMYGKSLKRAV